MPAGQSAYSPSAASSMAQNSPEKRPIFEGQPPAAGGQAHHHARNGDAEMAARSGRDVDAWTMFIELDEDGDGLLDQEELKVMMTRMGASFQKKTVKKLQQDFSRAADPNSEKKNKKSKLVDEKVDFPTFVKWYRHTQEEVRNKQVRTYKELFKQVDRDSSGRLTRDEFCLIARKAKFPMSPPFDEETDWRSVRKVREGLDGHEADDEMVTYAGFEQWFKRRLDIEEPDIPVLPEFMVQVIEEAAKVDERKHQKRLEERGEAIPKKSLVGERSGKELWALLRPRLLTLVRMQRKWGPIHDLYDAVVESRYSGQAIPPNVIDPDSKFSQRWDLTQVVLLLYVAMVVPLRAGFDIEVELWTVAFFWDMMIDFYFAMDIWLSFRMAFWTSDGVLETNKDEIARHYCKGWFLIDLVSTLPVSYLVYFSGDEVIKRSFLAVYI